MLKRMTVATVALYSLDLDNVVTFSKLLNIITFPLVIEMIGINILRKAKVIQRPSRLFVM